ncbi:MAG TPA: ABC transporter permease [Anaerovoracaceae bacterium]|nr:ABC transporter permease [Anaerovoracaceae bacterium]
MDRIDQKMISQFESFRRSPAFTGFVLFSLVLLLNIALQGPENFFTASNFGLLLEKNTPLILVTMAQAMLMLLGMIDISIGVQLSLVNVIAIMLPQELGVPWPIAWAAGILSVMLIAAINGLFVAYMRIPSLLSSFAMIYIVKGINVIIMSKPQGTVPEVVWRTYSSEIGGVIPITFLIIAIIFLLWIYMKKTSYMKHVYAVGGNERNAYASGINPARVKMKAFLISGFITGIAGLCLTAMSASGNPLMGEAYGLKSIAACILGGIALSGGWGTMSCALFGSGFLVLIQSSVYYLFKLLYVWIPGFQVTTYWQNLVSDGIILLGLVATIFTAQTQRAAFKTGLKKQLKGGERLGE